MDKANFIDISAEKLAALLKSAGSSFSPDKIIDDNFPQIMGDEREVLRSRLLHQANIQDCDFTEDNKVFFRRSDFFASKEFIILPTAEEIDAGILIPGHRFVPFLHQEHSPSAVLMKDVTDGMVLKTFSVEEKIADLLPLYVGLGVENVIDVWAAESENNRRKLKKNPGADVTLSLEVFDCRELYRKYNFAYGDALRCRTLDYYGDGLVAFSYFPGAGDNFAILSAQSKLMAKYLDMVNELQNGKVNVQNQLAWLLFYGRNDLDTAKFSFEAVLNEENGFELQEQNGCYLWHTTGKHCSCGNHGHHHCEEELPGGLSLLPDGVSNNPSDILIAAGVLFLQQEILALAERCVRAHGVVQDFSSEVLRGSAFDELDEFRQSILLNFLEEVFEAVEESFNRDEPGELAHFREQLLDLAEERRDFLIDNAEEFSGGKLNRSELDKLAAREAALLAGLRELSADDDKLISRMSGNIQDLAEAQERLLDAMEGNDAE